KTVASMVEAQQYLDALTAASLPTAGVTIFNTADQKYYGRTGDAWKQIYTTADDIGGTITATALTGTIVWARSGRTVNVWYDLNGTNGSDRQVGQLPPEARPGSNGIKPFAEYQYGTLNNPGYVDGSGGVIRMPTQTGTSRRVGNITFSA